MTRRTFDMSRRTALGGMGAFAFASLMSGCGSGFEPVKGVETAPNGSTAVSPEAVFTNNGPIIQANVVVGSAKAGTIGAGFCGLSYEKSQLALPFFQAQNTRAISLFKRLGVSNLRLGGNSVDKTLWVANGKGQTAGQVAPSDVDGLASFLNATGWNVLYGINLATSTPALAAAEIAYVSKVLGNKLVGVEIGNEPDGYNGSYFTSGWSVPAYIARWQQFANAILALAPNVPLTGPAIGILGHVNSWTEPFVSAQAAQIKQITQHYYIASGSSATSTMDMMLTPDPALATALSQLQVVSAGSRLPFRFSETNSFYNGGKPGVSNTGGAALWAVDYLFQLAQGGAVGANFEGGGSYSKGYQPISDTAGLVLFAPPPIYSGLLLFTMIGSGTILSTSIAAGPVNATAYAVQNNNGTLNIVVINKDSSQNLSLVVNAGRKINKATAMTLSMPSLSATTGVTIQGGSVGVDGSFSPQAATALSASGNNTTINVSAYSAVLIQIT